jgi:hypothetical protein
MAGKKRRRRSMETPYARITEIREAATSEEANECLNSGFVLIKAVEKRETDALGRQASNIVYVLGKLRQNGTQTATHHNGHSEQQPDTPIVDPAVLENRPWRAYAKGEGEWTFVVNQDGSPVAELEPARQFLDMLKDGDDLVVGAYRYRLRDKFLKRYPADSQSA